MSKEIFEYDSPFDQNRVVIQAEVNKIKLIFSMVKKRGLTLYGFNIKTGHVKKVEYVRTDARPDGSISHVVRRDPDLFYFQALNITVAIEACKKKGLIVWNESESKKFRAKNKFPGQMPGKP